jgi:hypothetical protein
MKKLTLFWTAIVCLVFSYCRKDNTKEAVHRYSISLEEARSFFNKELASQERLTQRSQLIDAPDWQHVSSRLAGDKEVLIVPLKFKKDLTIKAGEGKMDLSLQSLTNLFFYKDAADRIVAEVITTIPDDGYVLGKEAAKPFTGMVWIEAWDGKQIGGYRYSTDGNIIPFRLGREIVNDSLLKERELVVQYCYVDFYYCVDASGFVTCRYNFSQSFVCGIGGGDMGAGGLSPNYYPVYSNGNGSGGSSAPGDETVGIGMNTVLIGPPDRVITDPWQYKRCFTRSENSTYKVILYVDQPKAGTRALMADGEGHTSFGSIENDTKTFGHAWISFEEKRSNGNIIRRAMGFWPAENIRLSTLSAAGVLGNDDDRYFDVSLEIGVVKDAFFSLLDDCSMGNYERYSLNNNNCTGWAIDKIYKNLLILLPRTLASWPLELGEGPTPGNLGEDLRAMDVNQIMGNSRVTNIRKNAVSGPSLKNSGSCPILPAP